MPINVTVHEPRSRVVCREAEGNVVSWTTNAHDITSNGVCIVVSRATSDPNNVEIVSVKVNWVRETTRK